MTANTLLAFPDCSQTDQGTELPGAHSSPTWPRPAQLPDWSFNLGPNSGPVWGTADVAGIALWVFFVLARLLTDACAEQTSALEHSEGKQT